MILLVLEKQPSLQIGVVWTSSGPMTVGRLLELHSHGTCRVRPPVRRVRGERVRTLALHVALATRGLGRQDAHSLAIFPERQQRSRAKIQHVTCLTTLARALWNQERASAPFFGKKKKNNENGNM
eukprot:1323861-Pleurochrysis_carterae.AAC.1